MKEQKFWVSPPPQDHLEKNFRSGAATTQNCHKHCVKHRHRIVKHCMKYKYRIVTNTVWNTNTTQNCQTHYVKHKHNHRIVKHKHHTETLLEAQQQHPTCFGFACFGRDSCLTWCGKCFFLFGFSDACFCDSCLTWCGKCASHQKLGWSQMKAS